MSPLQSFLATSIPHYYPSQPFQTHTTFSQDEIMQVWNGTVAVVLQAASVTWQPATRTGGSACAASQHAQHQSMPSTKTCRAQQPSQAKPSQVQRCGKNRFPSRPGSCLPTSGCCTGCIGCSAARTVLVVAPRPGAAAEMIVTLVGALGVALSGVGLVNHHLANL